MNHDWLLGERNPHWDWGWKIYFPAFVTVTYKHPVEIALLPLDHLVRNCLSWKSSLNVTHYNWGHFCCNHGMSYIITNLTIMAIWRSNGFRIHAHIAEKQGTLLFSATFGHTVLWLLTAGLCNIPNQNQPNLFTNPIVLIKSVQITKIHVLLFF